MMFGQRQGKTRAVVVAIWVLAGLLVLAPSAGALPGGKWASAKKPLNNSYRGVKVGSSHGNWQGYREDQGRGSRVQNSTYRKLTGRAEIKSRGTYVKHEWYFNANRCYVTSFKSAGIGCGTGWWESGHTNTSSTKSKKWKYAQTWRRIDPKGESARGKMHTCEDLVFWPNNCSKAYFLRGSSY